MKIRMKTVKVQKNGATPRVEPKMPSKDVKAQKEQKDRAPQKDRVPRPSFKPSRPINTKPKNPSPLSASPPVNASDFEDTHPVHKALSGAPSPSKASVTNSDRSLKRKANDLDNGIHDHFTSVKQARVDRPTPTHTPASTNGRGTSTPLSASSLKRRSDDSSTSDTSISKFRKGNTIDTSLSARYTDHNGHSTGSPDDSSSTTSPVRLSFRQTVELSQKFTQYYKRYEELYWKLADSDIPPTDTQRAELMKMHKKLEEMKRNIKDGGR
jgi:RNA polymerase II elongation factor ELL